MDTHAIAAVIRGLAAGASIEVTPAALAPATPLAPLLPAGMAVHVPFLPGRRFADTVAACKRLHDRGLRPVPHLAARRVASREELDSGLHRLAAAGVDSVFLVAGDTRRPDGPFVDSLAVLGCGLLARHGVRRIGVAGYPEGHPVIAAQDLNHALVEKAAYARETGTDMWVVTQFAFEAAPVVAWLNGLRTAGVTLPVRVGLAGPTPLRTLLSFAIRCGIGASARVLMQRPEARVMLTGRWSPDDLLTELARHCADEPGTPLSGIHLFPFGGVGHATAWLEQTRARAEAQIRTEAESIDPALTAATR